VSVVVKGQEDARNLSLFHLTSHRPSPNSAYWTISNDLLDASP